MGCWGAGVVAGAGTRRNDASVTPGATVTIPVAEPVVPLAELKKQVESVVEETFHDAQLEALELAAVTYAQDQTGRQFVKATYVFAYDSFPGGRDVFHLPRTPVDNVSLIEYDTPTDTIVTMPAADYIVGTYREPCRVSLAQAATWPTPASQGGSVRITAECGYGVAADVPRDIKTLILMLVDDWFNNRSGQGEATPAADALLDSLRIHDFITPLSLPGMQAPGGI